MHVIRNNTVIFKRIQVILINATGCWGKFLPNNTFSEVLKVGKF